MGERDRGEGVREGEKSTYCSTCMNFRVAFLVSDVTMFSMMC